MSQIYSKFEALVNSAIQELISTDPANTAYLERLNGSLVSIHCQMPQIDIAMKVQDSMVSLSALENSVEPELRVTATALNLLKLLSSPIENAAMLKQSGVEITGDVGLLVEISQVAEKIEIDWEQLLSEKVGETPAVLFSRALKIGLKEAKKASEDFSSFTNKTVLARGNFPTQNEAESTRKEIRELNYRLDRIEASLRRKAIEGAKAGRSAL